MASEHEIERELEELKSSLPEISRRPPFERNEDYLYRLPDMLADFVQTNNRSEKDLSLKREIAFPVWVRGIAAALLLLIPGTILYRWMNPENTERKVSRELQTVDAGSIEAYLQQSIETDESGISRFAADIDPWPVQQQLAALDPTEIESYLNNYPSIEESQN